MITITKTISLNGEEMAEEFWELNSKEQAEFFNKNKLKDNNWNHGKTLIQIDSFVDMLDDNGREFIEKIYNSLQDWHYYND